MAMSGSELAAAVSNAGGLGMLGCSRLTPEQIREMIRRTRSLTSRPFGADILAPILSAPGHGLEDLKNQIPQEYWDFIEEVKKELDLPDVKPPDYALTEDFLRQQVEVIIAEKVPIFATGLGTPSWIIEEIRSHNIKYISMVGRVKHALWLKEKKPDVIIASGTEAGGHTGKIGTCALIPLVVDAVSPIPVAAAGGISDGRGLAAALALGAVGVWMGTAFLATNEALRDTVRYGWMTRGNVDAYKKTILRASEDDAVVTRVKTGKTCRMYRNKMLDLWEKSGLRPLDYQLQTIIMGELDAAFMEAEKYEYVLQIGGQAAGNIKELKNAGDLVREMAEHAASIIGSKLPPYIS